MRIHEIGGEFALIDRLASRSRAGGGTPHGMLVGIGDDAAVVRSAPGRDTVVTVDMLIEGVHFRRDWSDMYSIGWKCAAVNLSDIASMGADPDYAFLSLALTPADTVESVDDFYDGFLACLSEHGGALTGGDTNSSPGPFVAGVTLLGSVAAGRAVLRSGARPGDILLVTGSLGDSAAGLALLIAGEDAGGFGSILERHRRPTPRVAAGRAAAATGLVHAAMDISDGLAGDLPKLCAASNLGARIDAAALPISETARDAAVRLGRPVIEFAIAGGEDFELLLAVDPVGVEAVIHAVEAAGVAASAIGSIVPAGIEFAGLPADIRSAGGWDHFSGD
ncbi:MAG: thiamine-phosphate kinase [Capsulimonadaceae bacterium]